MWNSVIEASCRAAGYLGAAVDVVKWAWNPNAGVAGVVLQARELVALAERALKDMEGATEASSSALKNVGGRDISLFVEAAGMPNGLSDPTEEEIRESNGGTAHPWLAWYSRGLEAICNDDLEALKEATKNMVEIYVKVVEGDEAD